MRTFPSLRQYTLRYTRLWESHKSLWTRVQVSYTAWLHECSQVFVSMRSALIFAIPAPRIDSIPQVFCAQRRLHIFEHCLGLQVVAKSWVIATICGQVTILNHIGLLPISQFVTCYYYLRYSPALFDGRCIVSDLPWLRPVVRMA